MEIYLDAALSMARKGLIVAAYCVVQWSSGELAIGNYGFRPARSGPTQNIRLYTNAAVIDRMTKKISALRGMASRGELIGLGGTVLIKDGGAEIFAAGSLSGMRAVLQAIGPQIDSVDRRQPGSERRSLTHTRPAKQPRARLLTGIDP